MAQKVGFEEAQAEFRLTFGERLAQLIRRYPTRGAASDVAGVTTDMLPKYISGRAKPSFELVARLAAVYGVSLDWLAYGRGPAGEIKPGLVEIPVIDIAYRSDSTPRTVPPVEVIRYWGSEPDTNFRAVYAPDRSGEPQINIGDTLIVDITETTINGAGYYLFRRDGAYMLRWADFDLRGGYALRGSPTATTALLLTMTDLSEVQIIGRVRWRIGAV